MGKAHRRCPICESPHLEYEFVVDKSPVCGCQDCGLLFLSPQPARSPAGERLTPVESSALTDIYAANARERLRELVLYSGRCEGKLLLIGADEHLCAEARKAGFEV